MQLINYILLLGGLVYLVTQAGITAPFRMMLAKRHMVLEMFIYCQACTGFWVGLALAYTGHWPFTGWPIESAVAGAALGALWKEWGCQTNVHKMEMMSKPLTEAERRRIYMETLNAETPAEPLKAPQTEKT
jgi:hypothetical protein